MSAPLVLAIDGGNSKTDLALVRGDGEVLALARGPLSSPHHIGLEGALQVIDDLLAEALDQAGIENGKGPVADVGQLLLAGVDFPSEVEQMQEAAGARGFARSVTVGNDTLAVLRAGTEHGWGVAIVCGAGINCVGVAPDGRQAGFPALGCDDRRLGRRLRRRRRRGARPRPAARTGAARRRRSNAPSRSTSGSRRRCSSPRRSTPAASATGG